MKHVQRKLTSNMGYFGDPAYGHCYSQSKLVHYLKLSTNIFQMFVVMRMIVKSTFRFALMTKRVKLKRVKLRQNE